jgi:hypothetical protein
MKTYVHVWHYLAELFLEWEMFQSRGQNENTYFMFENFFRKSCLLWDNVEKYGRARQATDDNIIQRVAIGCWITEAMDTHLEDL